MSSSSSGRTRRPPSALVAADATLPDLLAGLAARMAPEQRAAFLGKMAAMDRQSARLTAASVTLGRA